METNEYKYTGVETDENVKSLQELLGEYLKLGRWIVLSLILCLAAAGIYLRYALPQHKVSAKILIRDEKRGQGVADNLTVFRDLGLASASGNIDNELEILNSKSLMNKMADSLRLRTCYFKEGRVIRTELYADSPLLVSFTDPDPLGTREAKFTVDRQSDGGYLIQDRESDFTVCASADQAVPTPWGELVLSPSGKPENYPLTVEITPKDKAELPEMEITPVNKKTSGVVEISVVSPVPEKNADMINTLIRFYNARAVEDKRWATEQTILFINDRLASISGQLERIEKEVEGYKQSYNLTDVQSEAGLYLNQGSEYDKRIFEIELQKEILASVERLLSDPTQKDNALPANTGMTDTSLAELINKYNEMQLEKRNMSLGMTPENTKMLELDNRITLLRHDIRRSVRIAEQNYNLTLKNLQKKESAYSSKINALSTNEREFLGYLRQQKITESIFLYLLQKREEAAITLSMTAPNAVMVDETHTDPIPVSPKRLNILLVALLAGLVLPSAIAYVYKLFSFRIKSREELEQSVTAPVLGILFKNRDKSDITVREEDRSHMTEMYRQVSVNLSFMLQGEGKNTVMVTSSLAHEGKSTFAVNLALTYATLGKKVLLVDLDMRNSRMGEITGVHTGKGMSLYLSNPSVKTEDIIEQSSLNRNFYFIQAGVVPPNPMELLLNGRLEAFFTQMRGKYDMIITDTPPVIPVSDAQIITKMCDATVYVTRYGMTGKYTLKYPEQLHKEGKLCNPAYILTGVPQSSARGYGYGYGYGYGQGYGYGEEKKKKRVWNLKRK